MQCNTVKEGIECTFMEKSGCTSQNGTCYTIIDKCEGCQKVSEFPSGRYCSVFSNPPVKWRMGNCTMASHIKVESKKSDVKVNPLKASKRGSGKK